MPFNVNNTTVVTDDRIVQSVSGPVGSRPGTPTVGMMFFNTTDSIMEVYNGTTWVSSTTGGTATPSAWAWGNNSSGELGDTTGVNKSSPVNVPVGGFTDWTSISGGAYHNIGVRANGSLWSWGLNNNGQLGHYTNIGSGTVSPIAVLGGFTDWTFVSSGDLHSIGIRATGQLYVWGFGSFGTIGDGTTVNKSSPTLVSGGFTNWVSASAGSSHCLGIRANGTLYAWGNNNNGVLGDGTTANKSSPTLVTGGIVDWISAAGGFAHSLAIRANGTLYSWGSNSFGQLGDNSLTSASKSSPVLVAGGFTDWTSASAGLVHSLGIRATGQLYAWGNGTNGRLGDGTTVSKSSPVLVAGGFTDWVSAEASLDLAPGGHNLGLRANGVLYSWGSNSAGQLGINLVDFASRSSPVSVIGGFTNWVSVSVTNKSSLGIRRS